MENPINPQKLTIGWFTFTCCEDSTMLMIELLNTRWQKWIKLIDFKYVKILRQHRPLGPMDVAFIEGAISSTQQTEKLKKIRSFAKKLVAIGSCAVTGQPSAQRNLFSDSQKQEIQTILEKFQYADKVQKLDEVVTVDYQVPGCPMDENKFLELIDKLLKEFNITK